MSLFAKQYKYVNCTSKEYNFFNTASFNTVWCGSVMDGWGVGLVVKRLRVWLSAVPISRNDSGQVVHTHMPLCHQSIWFGINQKSGDSLHPRLGRLPRAWRKVMTSLSLWLNNLRAEYLETGIIFVNTRVDYFALKEWTIKWRTKRAV